MPRRWLSAALALPLSLALVACAGVPTATPSRPAPAGVAPTPTGVLMVAPSPTAQVLESATIAAAAAPTRAAAPALATVPPSSLPAQAAPPAAPAGEPAEVLAVVDGDTITVRLASGATNTVRYIGVDTPETKDPRVPVECFGAEASARNAELVAGRTVYLERDVSERDRYDRLLRYVWVEGDDGALRFANEELVKWGHASAVSFPPDVKYQQRFADAERVARQEGRGLWGACEGPHAPLTTPATATAPPPAPTPVPPTAVPVRPTNTPVPPRPTATTARSGNCDPSYPTVCIPPPPPDLDCGEISFRRFAVRQPDPHRFDGDRDGIGCE
jgi:micrococcal nuclease